MTFKSVVRYSCGRWNNNQLLGYEKNVDMSLPLFIKSLDSTNVPK